MLIHEILKVYGPAVELAAVQAGVRPALVLAVIREGSGGNPRYFTDEGAVGLCIVRQQALTDYNLAHETKYQLRDLAPANGSEPGGAIHDAAVLKNIAVCCWGISHLLAQFNGDYQLAVQAYFAGGQKVKAAARLGRARADAVFSLERTFAKELEAGHV